jgi:hypothetical protein
VTNITSDTQNLINYCVDFADKMLTENHEFYPFAVTVNFDGDLVMVSHFDGDDHPLSQDLINKLQLLLDYQLDNKEKRAYALTSDVVVKKDASTNKTDAIAIKIKHLDSNDIKVYYFAYILSSENKVEYLDSWGEIDS